MEQWDTGGWADNPWGQERLQRPAVQGACQEDVAGSEAERTFNANGHPGSRWVRLTHRALIGALIRGISLKKQPKLSGL